MPANTIKEDDKIQKSFIGQIISFGNVQVLLQLRSLIALPILARLLGAEGFGTIAPLTALSSIVQAIVLVGTNTSLTIFIPRISPKKRAAQFWGVFQLTLATSFLAVLLLAILFPIIRPLVLNEGINFDLYLASLLLIPANTLNLILFSQIINNQQGKQYSGVVLLNSVFDILVTIGFAYLWGLSGVIAAMVLSQLLLALLTMQIIRKVDSFVPLAKEQLAGLKVFYSYGLLVFVSGFASNLVASSDRLIISRYLPVEEVGVYDVIYNLTSKINQLAVPLYATLMPFVVRSIEAKNTEKAKFYLNQTARILLFVFLPFIFLYWIEGYDILLVLTGRDFVSGISLIPWIAFGMLLWQLSGVFNYNLHAHQKGKFLLISLIAGAIINVVLNLIFVPVYGSIAAAISTLAAYVVILVMNAQFSSRYLPFNWGFATLGKILLSCALMSLIILPLKTQLSDANPIIRLLVVSGSGGILYLLFARMLNLLTPAEQDFLWITARSVFQRNPRKS